MTIIAYTYEADVHCIACTLKRCGGWPGNILGKDSTFPYLDREGNLVHPLFSTDEWQELDDSFLAENPTQYLACGDCHEIIDEYTVESEVTA